jgi:hypothetical protein
MVFNRKEVFRHDFGSEGAKPAAIAIRPAAEKPAAVQSAPAKTMAPKPGDSNQPPAPKGAEAASSTLTSTLTTAEAIAAELRAAQESMPAPSTATFAPDCLTPGSALPMRRRRGGANLAEFKAMAGSLFGKR